MLSNNSFVRQSLDLNLVFLRIMKEHSLFMAVAFIEKNKDYIDQALKFHDGFTIFLNRATELSRGVLEVQNDAVTDYTLDAETITKNQTGVNIDTRLTKTQMALRHQTLTRINTFDLNNEVRRLNGEIIEYTKNLIRYKTNLYNDILSCKILFNAYPLLIDHIRREAILYVDLLNKLQNNQFERYYEELVANEIFWNQIMEEHSEFIRGLLDPTEESLMEMADDFAENYEELNRKVYNATKNPGLVPQVTRESIELTKEINQFKTQATIGLINCQIKAVISPLLADHVLRESNHYLRLLNQGRKH